MRECEQSPGQSVWDHGKAVARRYIDLRGPREMRWRLPDWVDHPEITDHLLSNNVVLRYHLFHDCGKPLCRQPDGRFPDHAAVSRRAWLDAGGSEDIGELIGMDMDVHLLKADGVHEFSMRKQAPTLLWTGLSELHANADMFGGIDSVGFKIKGKELNKRGRQVLTVMKR